MAVPVYSVLIFSQQGVDVPTVVGPPPTGLLWVIRDICAYVGAPSFSSTLFFKDGDNSAAFLNYSVDVGTSRSFHDEIRQVIEAGHTFIIDPESHAWDVRISGYALGAPP